MRTIWTEAKRGITATKRWGEMARNEGATLRQGIATLGISSGRVSKGRIRTAIRDVGQRSRKEEMMNLEKKVGGEEM